MSKDGREVLNSKLLKASHCSRKPHVGKHLVVSMVAGKLLQL